MANKYTRKKPEAVKQTDEFVTFWQKVYDYATPYTRPIAYVTAGAVVLFFVVYGVERFTASSRQGATEALA